MPFLVDAWETDDGLPENSATSLIQTPDGYLWFGTFNGLVRFDGNRFSVFDPVNTPGLPSTGIITLHLDRRERLWASTDRGLAIREGKTWRRIGPAHGWTGNLVRYFAESAKGQLAISTFEGRIFMFDETRFVEVTPPNNEQQPGYTCYFDAAGQLWAANAGFYGRWNGKEWEQADRPWTVTNYEYCGAGAGHDLIVLAGKKLLRMRDGKVVAETELTEPIRFSWSLREDPTGRIWVCSYRSGLFVVEPSGEVRRYGSKDGLTYEGLRFTFEDREGNIWVGSSGGGLMRLKRRNFFQYGVPEGLPDRVVKSITRAGEGVLVGTHGGGAAVVKNGVGMAFGTGFNTNVPVYLWSVLVDSKNRTWAGSYEQGLRVLENGTSRLALEGNLAEGIFALFEDSRGAVWAGTASKVVRFSDEGVTHHGKKEGITSGVRCFAQDPVSGKMWAGSHRSGLLRYEDGSWVAEQAVGEREIWSLHFEPDGTLWIGTAQDGLLRLQGGKIGSVSEPEGLPSRSIGGIMADGQGHFWLASNNGIIRLRQDRAHEAADRKLKDVEVQLFTLSDGLASIECAGGFQPTMAKTADGRLWFATLKGAVSVDPAKLTLNRAEPAVVVEEVFIDDVRTGYRRTPKSEATSIEIPAGARELRIVYSALSLTAPEKMKFRYQLVGLHNTWQDVGNRRVAYFNDLKPGDYTFKVIAANNDGLWSQRGAALGIAVAPLPWQTWWFRALALGLCAAAAGAATWFTSRRRTELHMKDMARVQAMSEVQTRLASVLENTSDFVAFSNATGRALYVNRSGRRLIGLEDEQSLHGMLSSTFFARWAAQLIEQVGLPTALRDGTWEGETALKHADGRELPVSQVIIAHRSADGALEFTSTIARDLSQTKQAESALRESEERFRRMAENLHDVLWLADAKTRQLTYVSPAYERIWQRSVANVLANRASFMDGIHPHDWDNRSRMFDALFESLSGDVEYRVVRMDGSIRWIRERAFPIRDAAGNVQQIAGIAEDFTERKEEEEQRETLEAQLRQSQKMDAVGQLAGGVAHDFNNILTIIQGNAELLASERLAREQEMAAAREISEAADRAASLTRQLLTFSRRQAVQPLLLNLNEVIGSITRMLERLIGEHIRLTTEVSSEPTHVVADRGMIEQIIVNLAVNARDAMPDGGKLLVCATLVTLDEVRVDAPPQARPGRFVRLQIKDTGVGIEPELMPHLFEPFFTTKAVGKGTGLGLATVFGIVEQHHGWIEVASEPGHGATFTVYLPHADVVEGVGPEPVNNPDATGLETILLVEDEEQLRKLVRLLLEQQGYNVVEAASGKAALETHDTEKIDLLLTDMVMPDGISGRVLGETLLARHPHLRVIYTSGYSVDMVAKEFSLMDGVNFLPKPYHPSKLLSMVRNSLDSRDGVGSAES